EPARRAALARGGSGGTGGNGGRGAGERGAGARRWFSASAAWKRSRPWVYRREESGGRRVTISRRPSGGTVPGQCAGAAGEGALTRREQVNEAERGRIREVVARRARGVPVVETTHRPLELVNCERRTLPLECVRDRPIAAFCGLGNPSAFRRTLLDLGAA